MEVSQNRGDHLEAHLINMMRMDERAKEMTKSKDGFVFNSQCAATSLYVKMQSGEWALVECLVDSGANSAIGNSAYGKTTGHLDKRERTVHGICGQQSLMGGKQVEWILRMATHDGYVSKPFVVKGFSQHEDPATGDEHVAPWAILLPWCVVVQCALDINRLGDDMLERGHRVPVGFLRDPATCQRAQKFYQQDPSGAAPMVVADET
jgi:hypothetical protein